MSNFSTTYQCYLQGYVGDVAECVDHGASERMLQALALGVYHRTTSRSPLMSSVAVTTELRAMMCRRQVDTQVLKGRCTLHRVGENKIAAIRAAREVTNLGLKEAKDLIDACTGVAICQSGVRVGHSGGTSVVIVDNDLVKAEQTAKLLRDAGCGVEVS